MLATFGYLSNRKETRSVEALQNVEELQVPPVGGAVRSDKALQA